MKKIKIEVTQEQLNLLKALVDDETQVDDIVGLLPDVEYSKLVYGTALAIGAVSKEIYDENMEAIKEYENLLKEEI